MKYISRFILGIGLLSGLLMSGGCRKSSLYDRPFGPEDTALVDAVLILRCNEMRTKASLEEQEKQINDLNLFFVHKSYPSAAAPEVRHYYFSSVDVAKHIKLTNIRLGQYRMYAVANAGQRLCSDSHDPLTPTAVGESFCSMTEDQIKALEVSLWEDEADLTRADNLPMSAYDPDMVIRRSNKGDPEPVQPTIQITLKRKVAKYEFSYELLGPMAGAMKIKSVTAKYVPGQIAMFGTNKPLGADKFNLEMDPLLAFGNGSSADVTDPVIFYWPENMQGDVAGIENQSQRNGQKAPKYASYIFLDGEYQNDQYGFSIYLGDSRINNFDVGGNAYYRVHLQLQGLDPDDVRISSMKIDVLQDFNSSIKVGETTEAIVEIICSNYFNDELTLVCDAVGARGEKFQVFPLDAAGNQGDEFDDVAAGDFWYNVLTTDDQPGEKRIKCKILYTQSVHATPIQMTLMLRSRYGTARVLDLPIIVRK